MPPRFVTATMLGWARCDHCGAINRGVTRDRCRCAVCGATLPRVEETAQERRVVWALLLAAFAFYFPANLLPVMTVANLGRSEPSTLIGGVIHLYVVGSWGLATIVLVASVLIPFAKMVVLGFVLWVSGTRRRRWQPVAVRWLRWIGWLGRWSMVDVFVVALLAAWVQFGEIAAITPGAGTLAFAAVVVLTMVATERFRPRWLWWESDFDGT